MALRLARIDLGAYIERLTPSTTVRNIQPGIIGRIGGLDPGLHENPASEFSGFPYFPVQWQNGLWSSLRPEDEGTVWNLKGVAENNVNGAGQPSTVEDETGGIEPSEPSEPSQPSAPNIYD